MKKYIKIFAVLCLALVLFTSCADEKSKILFTTEYDVADYCENAVIVSKTDGRVYSLLNENGKEILSNYDDIYFLNKDNYIEGTDKNLYILTSYEDEYAVCDIKGKEILKTNNNIHSVHFKLPFEKSDNTPFVYLIKDDKYILYNEKGDIVAEISTPTGLEEIEWLSDNCYLTWNIEEQQAVLYDYSGNILHYIDGKYHFYGITASDQRILFLSSDDGAYKTAEITADGTVTYGKTYKNAIDLYEAREELQKQNEDTDKTYKLYESNDTWKLEDLNGKPLYEERYFERFTPPGENECIALVNEIDDICLFGRQGNFYLEYGTLKYDSDDETVYLITEIDGEEEDLEVKEIHEGKNSIIIPIGDDNGQIIYRYKSK